MVERTLNVNELKERSLLDVLREVSLRHERLNIVLGEGEVVSISPSVGLEPLPELEGCIPKGWKDAVYE